MPPPGREASWAPELIMRIARPEDTLPGGNRVLARKAGSIRKTEALRSKRDAGGRRIREREAQPMPAKPQASEAEWHEVQAALDEEVQALPEIYRAPFVLCFLEGKSRAEVARELGIKEGTVGSRLSQARKRLHERLGRRGFVLPALLTVAALSSGSRAVSAALSRLDDLALAGDFNPADALLRAGAAEFRTATWMGLSREKPAPG
jgi:RNA polymerase sigma factor (sigma-70 family)